MNKYQVIGLLVAGFIAGDAEGILRQRRTSTRFQKNLRDQNTILKMKVGGLETFIDGMADGLDVNDCVEQFITQYEFINITKNLM